MLSRKEIIELRARAIRQTDEQNGNIREPWELLDKYNKQDYLNKAEATIEADEKAGVLMLSQDGGTYHNTKELAAKQYEERRNYESKYEAHEAGFQYGFKAARASTPVYQCRKEK